MIFEPPALALLLASGFTVAGLTGAAWHGIQVLKSWDLSSGNPWQLELERRHHLVETVLRLALGVEVFTLALLLFFLDAAALHVPGAMCAVGVLEAGPFGWPLLGLKLLTSLLAGLWLRMSRLAQEGEDFPWVTPLALGTLVLAALAWTELGLLVGVLKSLNPEVPVVCCSTSFGSKAADLVTSPLGLPAREVLGAFFGATLVCFGTALVSARARLGRIFLGSLTLGLAVVAGVALLEVLSPYVYELPHHHCPFCLIQPEYSGIGYAFYLGIYLALDAGIGLLALEVSPPPSLTETLAPERDRIRRQAMFAALGLGLLGAYSVQSSSLQMFGDSPPSSLSRKARP